MKEFVFDCERDFLNALDGKVYAISNGDGTYLCDVHEDTYVKMLDMGLCVNLDDRNDILTEGINVESYSQYILTKELNDFEQFVFKELFGIKITIKK